MPLDNGFIISCSGKIGSGKDLFADLLSLAIWNEKEPNGKKIPIEAVGVTDFGYPTLRQINNIQIVKFADALKDIVCRLTGCTREQLEDQDFKNSYMPREWDYTVPRPGKRQDGFFGKGEVDIKQRTYREFLQELGTNVLRNWIPNIHVNATFAPWKPVPVKDTKFKNWGKQPGELKAETEQWPKWIITDMRFPNEAQAVKERGGILLRIDRGYDIGTGRYHESETALDDYNQWDAVIDNNGTIEELYQQAIKIVKQFKLT